MSGRLTSVRIARPALEAIANEGRAACDGMEVGGALFGFDASEHGPLLITHATGPGPDAVRRRRRFSRDTHHAAVCARKIYAESSAHWVGEWHTHPSGSGSPSQTDIRSYRRHLDDGDLRFSVFISMILTPLDPAWHAVAVHPWAVDATDCWRVLALGIPENFGLRRDEAVPYGCA